MPIPKPNPDEKEDAYVGRCMAAIGDEYEDKDQALAVCYSTFKEGRKKQMNDQLLEAIRQRQAATEFGYGITTADRYAKNVLDAVGLEVAYKCAATRTISWDDVMRKAARTLVYSNPDMITEEIEYSRRAGSTLKKLDDVELPKNCLMVFRHVLTTPRKDRDGDVLRTGGAKVDPKMILLWNHVHTLPIGKMLAVSEHNSKKLSLVSCIVDMNDLSHDCAVMIDNGMGRFSHGFRAIEFTKIKSADGEKEAGFDVKDFEIMEESLVTVPSNTDAEVEEVMLGLVEGGKMTSVIMKEYGKAIRNHRPLQVAGVDLTKIHLPIDLKITLNGKEIKDADLSRDGGGEAKGAGREADEDQPGLAKEADAKAAGKAEEAATDEEVKCPECGEIMKRSVGAECPKCGYVLKKGAVEDEDEEEVEEPEEEKSYLEFLTEKGDNPGHPFRGNQYTGGGGGTGGTQEGSGGGKITAASVRSAVEDAIGAKFSDETAKVIGNRTSVVKGVPYKGAAARRKIIDDLGAKLEPLGFARHAGRSSKETVWSTQGASHVVRAQDRTFQMLVECITTNDAKSFEPSGVKYGRTISAKSMSVLKEVHTDIHEMDTGNHVLSYEGRKLCGRARKKLKSFIDEHESVEDGKSFDVREAMAVVIAEASPEQRTIVRKAFDAIERVERANLQAKQYRALVAR